MLPRLILVFTAVFLVACGAVSPIQRGTLGSGGLFVDSVKKLPTSRHVTGLPYPSKCTTGNFNGHALPDRVCTPGAVDAEVIAPSLGNPGNLRGTICARGWAQSARAPQQETEPVKRTAMGAYGVRIPMNTVELDHLVPLELGGSNDVSNLWPEPSDLPGQSYHNTKDTVENTLNRAVCVGTVSLGAAQNAIANNWTTATQVLGLSR
jgi:hypothetical protein